VTDQDGHEWAWLCSWLRAAALPSEPYRLDRATLVADPVASHRHLRETVAGGPAAQVRAAALARMRTLRRLKESHDLYEKCPACGGTRKLKAPVHVDHARGRSENLPAGADCPSCRDGYVATGMTAGQAERLVRENGRLRALADAADRYVRSLRAGVPVLAERGADSAPFRAAADRSVAALRDLKDALADNGWRLT
jgi:hypothetical protein